MKNTTAGVGFEFLALSMATISFHVVNEVLQFVILAGGAISTLYGLYKIFKPNK